MELARGDRSREFIRYTGMPSVVNITERTIFTEAGRQAGDVSRLRLPGIIAVGVYCS